MIRLSLIACYLLHRDMDTRLGYDMTEMYEQMERFNQVVEEFKISGIIKEEIDKFQFSA